LDRSVLEVGRVAVFSQNPFHQDTQPRPRRLSVHPIDGKVAPQADKKLVRDDAQVLVAHDLNSALVLRESVVECDLVG